MKKKRTIQLGHVAISPGMVLNDVPTLRKLIRTSSEIGSRALTRVLINLALI